MEKQSEDKQNNDQTRVSKTGLKTNKLFWLIAVVVIVLAGIYGYMSYADSGDNQAAEQVPELPNDYTSEEYNFTFSYGNDFNAKTREEDNRDFEYLEEEVDFFVSFRDVVTDKKPVSIAFFYALPEGNLEQFERMINDSSKAGEVKGTKQLDVNGIAVTEVTSSTAAGTDKTHYVFKRGDNLIITSVFLNHKETFQPVLETLRPVE
jgi:heme/copper-type cytochrome/quinol oxidase subunit 2